MKLQELFKFFYLVNVIYATSTKDSNGTSLPEELVIYTAEYDVVQIVFPVNGLNFGIENYVENKRSTPIIFFVLADTSNKEIFYKGVHVRKNGIVSKLLDNGKDITAANDDSKTVYIAATDGIYSYNAKENKADKYGTITENILNISKFNGSDMLYVLTEDHVVYKVTEGGTKKDRISEVVNPLKIVMDYNNNLYYESNNNIYVYGSNGINQVMGVPKKINYVKFFRAPVVLRNAITVYIDDEPYVVYSNTTVAHETKDSPVPTSMACESGLLLYYGYNKKIYQFDIVTLWRKFFGILSR